MIIDSEKKLNNFKSKIKKKKYLYLDTEFSRKNTYKATLSFITIYDGKSYYILDAIKSKKLIKLFIQVNIGKEEQKSGISENELFDFYNYCKSLKLDILGLMCIPPFNEDSTKYFMRMRELSTKIGLNELSMGMSSDYLNAIENGSSFIRVGSNIFGQRG